MQFIFQSSSSHVLSPRLDGRHRHPFNDKRLASQWANLHQAQLEHQQIIVNQISQDKSEAAGFYRFLSNQRVAISELLEMNTQIESEKVKGREILVLGDTSSYNLKGKKDQIRDWDRVGVLEDNQTPGFFTHVSLALDAQSESILGLSDILLWKRNPSNESADSKSVQKNRQWEEKESYKWALGVSNSRKALAQADQLTYVFDREADSYELFEDISTGGDHFVIRSQYNRKIRWQAQELKVKSALSQSPTLGRYELDLPALNHYSTTKGKWIRRKKRCAQLEIRAIPIELPRPPKSGATLESLPLWAIEAVEIGYNLPEAEEPISWRLLTTLPVQSFEQAQLVIHYYTLRWIIEQLFRTMKKKGFMLESTQLETFDAILRQTIMAYKTACTVLQLVYARDKAKNQPIEQVFNHDEQIVLEMLNQKYQGKTVKQQNPYSRRMTSWAAWIIGRMGGWKGYTSQKRPPGPITMKRGLEKFQTYFQAYKLFNSS